MSFRLRWHPNCFVLCFEEGNYVFPRDNGSIYQIHQHLYRLWGYRLPEDKDEALRLAWSQSAVPLHPVNNSELLWLLCRKMHPVVNMFEVSMDGEASARPGNGFYTDFDSCYEPFVRQGKIAVKVVGKILPLMAPPFIGTAKQGLSVIKSGRFNALSILQLSHPAGLSLKSEEIFNILSIRRDKHFIPIEFQPCEVNSNTATQFTQHSQRLQYCDLPGVQYGWETISSLPFFGCHKNSFPSLKRLCQGVVARAIQPEPDQLPIFYLFLKYGASKRVKELTATFKANKKEILRAAWKNIKSTNPEFQWGAAMAVDETTAFASAAIYDDITAALVMRTLMGRHPTMDDDAYQFVKLERQIDFV